MKNEHIKDLKNTINTIKSELFQFTPLRDISNLSYEDGKLYSASDIVILADMENGREAHSIILGELEKLNLIYNKIEAELEIDCEVQAPDAVQKYVNVIKRQLHECIHLLGIFALGFEDAEGNGYTLEDFLNDPTNIYVAGKENRKMLDARVLQTNPQSITYRKLITAIAALMLDYENRYDKFCISVESLEYNKENDFPILKGPRQRLVLLKEIGILGVMYERYSNELLNHRKIAELIALMLGFSKESEIETIRKEFLLINNNTPAISGKGGNPLNDKSVGAVIEALEKLKIHPKNLPDVKK
jgi:hypothetical protein